MSNNELQENKHTSTRVLVVHEDDYTDYLAAGTDEEWAASCLYLLTLRYENGVYQEPNKLSPEELNALNMSDDDIAVLPSEKLRKIAEEDRNWARTQNRWFQEEKDWMKAMREVVENQDMGYLTLSKGNRYERREPKAWILLRNRNGSKYERVELVEVNSFLPQVETV